MKNKFNVVFSNTSRTKLQAFSTAFVHLEIPYTHTHTHTELEDILTAGCQPTPQTRQSEHHLNRMYKASPTLEALRILFHPCSKPESND